MKNKSKGQLALTIASIVLCVIFGLTLIFNLTIVIKGSINPDEPPSVFGVTPLVVTSGSMSGDAKEHIEVNDLIFIKDFKFEELEVGDVITFHHGRSYTTHRIVREGVDEKTGERVFYTKGDANNTEDQPQNPVVKKENIKGVYTGQRAPIIGGFILFMQKPIGIVTVIVVPIIAWIVCDAIFKRKNDKQTKDKTAELEAELERLRAAAAQAASAPATPVETPVETPTETPVETPVESPVETPAEEPVETLVETPAEAPVETPTEETKEA